MLYNAEWNRNNMRITPTTFSLSIPVRNVSQNGTVYQCTVTVQSCSPVSSDHCFAASRTVVGDLITLVVGGECTLYYCNSKLSITGILALSDTVK